MDEGRAHAISEHGVSPTVPLTRQTVNLYQKVKVHKPALTPVSNPAPSVNVQQEDVTFNLTRRPYNRRSGTYTTPVADVIDLSEIPATGTNAEWDEYPFPNHPYQCNFCKLIFSKLNLVEEHIASAHNIDKALVYVCYTRRKNRNKNKKDKDTADVKPDINASVMSLSSASSSAMTKKPEPKVACTVPGCAHVVTKALDLTYHKYLDHNIPLPAWTSTYHCPICGRLCRTKAALSTHLSRMHPGQLIPDNPAPPRVDSPNPMYLNLTGSADGWFQRKHTRENQWAKS